MTSLSNNEFKLFTLSYRQYYPFTTAAILPCYLSPEISAVGLEIHWFNESERVFHYKNRQVTEGINYEGRVSLDREELKRGNVSLQLRNCSWSDEGNYWCQVSDGDRTERLTVKVEIFSQFRWNLFTGKSPGVYVSPGQNRGTKQETKKKGKCFILVTGKTLNSEKHFMDRLKKQISVEEVDTVQECDFILVFCTIILQTGSDIEAAMRKLNNLNAADTKPVVLVVLHHTFNPDQIVPDSSRCVTRPNTITVDCLFYEDQELLRCSKNDESVNKATDYKKALLPSSLSRGTSISQKPSVGVLSSESGLPQADYAMGTGLHVQNIIEKDSQKQVMSILLSDILSVGERQQMDKDKQLQEKNKQLKEAEDELQKLKNIIKQNKKQPEIKDQLMKYNQNKLETLEKELQDRNSQIQKMMILMEQQKTELSEKDKQLEEKDRQVQEKDKQLQDKDKQLQDKDKQLQGKEKQQMYEDKQLQGKEILKEEHLQKSTDPDPSGPIRRSSASRDVRVSRFSSSTQARKSMEKFSLLMRVKAELDETDKQHEGETPAGDGGEETFF